MNNDLKECLVKQLRDNTKAYKNLIESSQDAITRYFDKIKLPGADKVICSRRLNTEFRYIISQYRESLMTNNLKFDEKTMGIFMTQMDHFMDSFYQEDQ